MDETGDDPADAVEDAAGVRRRPAGEGSARLPVYGPDEPAEPIDYTNWFYRFVFKPAVRRALPASLHGLRFPDLRHTCASLLIRANVGPKVVQKHLGHSSFAITYDRYGHQYPDEAAQQVSEALDLVFQNAPAV